MEVGSRWETDKLPVALLSTVKERVGRLILSVGPILIVKIKTYS
jgi:hypothetical protein